MGWRKPRAAPDAGRYERRNQLRLIKETIMKYKVHRLEIKMETDQGKLEQFLNSLEGELVSIIPNIARTSLVQIFGGSAKVDFLLIVEKIE